MGTQPAGYRCSEEEELIKHWDDPKDITKEKGLEDEQVCDKWGEWQRRLEMENKDGKDQRNVGLFKGKSWMPDGQLRLAGKIVEDFGLNV